MKHLTATGQSPEAEAYQSYKFGFTLGAAGLPKTAAIDYPPPLDHAEAEKGYSDGNKVFRQYMREAWERLGKSTEIKRALNWCSCGWTKERSALGEARCPYCRVTTKGKTSQQVNDV